MLFPESERVLYKNKPLEEVICQLRYPTILRIREGQLADFQDRVGEDYPVYSEQEPSVGATQQIPRELAAIIEQMNVPIIAPALITHRFSTIDAQRFISLRDDFVAFTETKSMGMSSKVSSMNFVSFSLMKPWSTKTAVRFFPMAWAVRAVTVLESMPPLKPTMAFPSRIFSLVSLMALGMKPSIFQFALHLHIWKMKFWIIFMPFFVWMTSGCHCSP